ncbi:MAG TPA: biliverdin-producing heme oxygenase [Marmoricola sp.]
MTVLATPADLLDGPLSVAMRDGTRTEHEAAEGSVFMEELLAGRIEEEGYADYLKRLRRVYRTMEQVGHDHRSDPIVAAVLDPALERLASIEADIAFWSADPKGDVASAATDEYVARLEATASWGGLFAAHHYTRYLGDLSGGQAIGRILAREFGLEGDAGIAFYGFAGIAKPKPYKDAYRAQLDALGFDRAQKERVVEEVKVAFGLNQALFEELDIALCLRARRPQAPRR